MIEVGAIIIVDAGSPDQVGFDIPDVPLLVIDHHATNGWELKDNDLMLQWDVRATTEIITKFLSDHASNCLSTNVRKMLLAGLITDTGRFKHANQSSFDTASLLLEDTDIDYAEFSEHLLDICKILWISLSIHREIPAKSGMGPCSQIMPRAAHG